MLSHKVLLFSYLILICNFLGTTVNRGPMEMATVFLAPPQYDKNSNDKSPDAIEELVVERPPPRLQNKLRLCFKDFSKK